MPGVHDEEKFKFVGCWLDQNFLIEVDRVRGEKTRSLFLREALAEKLKVSHVMIMRDKIAPPDRAGKGGPISYRKIKRKRKDALISSDVSVEEVVEEALRKK